MMVLENSGDGTKSVLYNDVMNRNSFYYELSLDLKLLFYIKYMNYYYLPFTFCGIGIAYMILQKKRRLQLVDTSKWTVKEWRLYNILVIMILENPSILKRVNKNSDSFKYFVEIRQMLNNKKIYKQFIEELINNKLLLK
jgi:hypothetical protein